MIYRREAVGEGPDRVTFAAQGVDLAGKIQDASENSALLSAMRKAFSRRDYDKTLAAFQQLSTTGSMPRDMRTEANCLAARALICRESGLPAKPRSVRRSRARRGAARRLDA